MSDAAPRVPGALDLGLDRYLAHSEDPLGGIREYFLSSFAVGDEGEPDPGCLLTNTAIESYSLAPRCRDAVSAGLARLGPQPKGRQRRGAGERG